MTRYISFALAILAAVLSQAQQVEDKSYQPPIADPVYREHGPVVLIDEGHHNFHTAAGRYQPFADLLRRDGYVVKPSAVAFTNKALAGARILVIANALSKENEKHWESPATSAFSDREIATLLEWLKGGGSLLLIVDHMPFPGCADKLASAFGIHFTNSYVGKGRGPDIFSLADGSLKAHPVVDGRKPGERVESVATFTGSAFQVTGAAEPLLVLGPDFTARPVADATAPRTPVNGWLQAATLQVGQGRLAVFGEAGMFTAQLSGPLRGPMGMNHPKAARNYQFALNVMHWLSGAL